MHRGKRSFNTFQAPTVTAISERRSGDVGVRDSCMQGGGCFTGSINLVEPATANNPPGEGAANTIAAFIAARSVT